MPRFLSVSILCLLLSGCVLMDLAEDVNVLNTTATISGVVTGDIEPGVPIVVALVQTTGFGSRKVTSYTVVYGESSFTFWGPAGRYHLFAFQDKNQNFRFDDGEKAGWYGKPSMLVTLPGGEYLANKIPLENDYHAEREIPKLFSADQVLAIDKTSVGRIGELVDKNFFNVEAGRKGMWEPVKFAIEGNAGIFFLEEYDPNKIPVLFIHGINGSGYEWLYMLEQLDLSRIQPWIVQYPSGLSLDLMGKGVSQGLNQLKATYNFDEVMVVAHSMGGLMARAFINHQASSNQMTDVSTFITLSTPWLGHRSAEEGVKRLPVPVPSWFDMVPGSPFLQEINKIPLPPETHFYMLFSHRGDGARVFGRSNTDGVVTLRSQLAPQMQEEAIKVMGFDETHISILRSDAAIEKVNDILKREARPNKPPKSITPIKTPEKVHF